MTEHETTASLQRAAPLRWWTILWAGALWMAAAALLVSVAFGCSAGETDDGQPDGGGAEAEAGEAAEPPATTRPEPEAGPDNAPPRTPWTVPPDDPARCAEAQAEAEALAPAALDGYDGGETTLASAEWWELARAVSRAITGGGPGCSSEEGSAADAVADLRLRESEAIELARLEALEARRAEDADDQAAAEAAVEQAWQEANGGALSGGAGALSEPDQGETTDPGPDSNPDRPGCQTEANPVSCQPPDLGPPAEGDPEGEIDGETGPDPDPEADPEPPVQVDLDPETPQSIIEFEDRADDIEEAAQTTRQHPGPVAYPAPVRLGSLADLLCPPEDEWRSAFYTGCGDGSDNDFLEKVLGAQTVNACWRGPIRLGVGDVLRMVRSDTHEIAGIQTWTSTVTVEILGFSEIDPTSTAGWVLTQPLSRSVRVDAWTLDDGAEETERSEVVGSPPNKWLQIGGPDNRGLNPDGTLAWGLMMLPTGDPEAC